MVSSEFAGSEGRRRKRRAKAGTESSPPTAPSTGLPLPEGVEPEDVKATYVDGILEVVVPGAAEPAPAKSKKIPVTAGKGTKTLAE